jgi:hypothetical protein
MRSVETSVDLSDAGEQSSFPRSKLRLADRPLALSKVWKDFPEPFSGLPVFFSVISDVSVLFHRGCLPSVPAQEGAIAQSQSVSRRDWKERAFVESQDEVPSKRRAWER